MIFAGTTDADVYEPCVYLVSPLTFHGPASPLNFFGSSRLGSGLCISQIRGAFTDDIWGTQGVPMKDSIEMISKISRIRSDSGAACVSMQCWAQSLVVQLV